MANGNWLTRKRTLFALSRLLHVYASSLLFGLLLFFCVTGITLNHRWYGDSVASFEERELSGAQLSAWNIHSDASWNPDLNLISAYVQTTFRLPIAYSIENDVAARELFLEYKVPAGFASITISGDEQRLYLETESGSFLGVVNDLHKGRHSGLVWFWLIDVSAALMLLFAVTGLIIIFQGKKRTRNSVFLVMVGGLSPILIWWFCVPH